LFGAFVSYRRALIEVATRIVGCRCIAEDVVQDTYLKLAEQPDATEVRQPVGYLFRIVRNLAIDRHRSQALERRYACSEEDGLSVGCVKHSPETILLGRESLSTVACALAELPERTRRAFELYRVEGHTQKEIALMLGVSPTLVNFMIRDALQHCRTALFG
jgi:RNA polymerase sigma factor (sigma-70 family)